MAGDAGHNRGKAVMQTSGLFPSAWPESIISPKNKALGHPPLRFLKRLTLRGQLECIQ
jgi:hypothetical protein